MDVTHSTHSGSMVCDLFYAIICSQTFNHNDWRSEVTLHARNHLCTQNNTTQYLIRKYACGHLSLLRLGAVKKLLMTVSFTCMFYVQFVQMITTTHL